ncbi:GNAT family N-acetyltransferase [Pseudoxanthomonas winnipegensis]|uniref:GNAT family N-acetyltransferase n=1 Tax=Pseudoxanthomonas winnipegensis TaxID=2480810 RepID=UPI0025759AD2|nr:GNAT family N-acetyltransferase [Pseudoxanthomonas winnipegensis]WJI15162.1 GNAT family N-acetyltransferase [Pseudoxanthomonas winnipegensis]
MTTEPIGADRYLCPDFPVTTCALRDGRVVTIRPLGVRDGDAELAFLRALFPAASRNRLLGLPLSPDAAMAPDLLDADGVSRVVLGGFVGDRLCGVAQYGVDGPDRICCEIATVVDPAFHDSGLAEALLEQLIHLAKARGLHHLYALALAADHEAARLLHWFGFQASPVPGDATLLRFCRPADPGA